MAGFVVLAIFALLVGGSLYGIHLVRRRWRAFCVAQASAQRARLRELAESIEEAPWESRIALQLPLRSGSAPPVVNEKPIQASDIPATISHPTPIPSVASPPTAEPPPQATAEKSAEPPVKVVVTAPAVPIEPPILPPRVVKTPELLTIKWIKPRERIEIEGHLISSGMFYAARSTESGWWLVDPAALLAGERTVLKSESGNQLALLGISPSFRSLYLDWLKGGRLSPAIGSFAACSFINGIAVRLLRDRAADEKTTLVAELLRLQALIPAAAHSLMHDSIEKLLPLIELACGDTSQGKPGEEKRYEISLMTKVAIGQLLKQGRTIPFEWMYAWYLESPNTYLRTPAQRLPEEFRALLAVRFAQAYPNGMNVKPSPARLRIAYDPGGRGQRIELFGYEALPDITHLTEPLGLMKELVEETTDALDGYSRFIGRNPELQDSLAAVHLLPADLSITSRQRAIVLARDWIREKADAEQSIEADALAIFLLGEKKPKYTAKDLRRMAELLRLAGYGMEPDPVFSDGTLSNSERVWVFSMDADLKQTEPTPGYRCAVVLADTLVSIGMADGSISQEERAAAEQIGPLLRLTEPELVRLRAHVHRRCAQKVTFTALRKKLIDLPAEMRHIVGRFAVTVAAADGILEKSEIRLLEKLYDELQIGRNVLFSDLHEASAREAQPATEPVLVSQEVSRGTGFAIPRPPEASPASADALAHGLDAARLQRILAETQQVSAVLGRIFQEEEAPVPSSIGSPQIPDVASPFPGLDPLHGILLQELAARAEWTRDEYVRIAQVHKLMPDGALETINEWAFDKFDEALIEDGDSVSINRSLLAAA